MALNTLTAYSAGTNAINVTFSTDAGDVKYAARYVTIAAVQLGFKQGEVAVFIYPNSVIDNTITLLNSDLVSLGTTASAVYDDIYAKLNA